MTGYRRTLLLFNSTYYNGLFTIVLYRAFPSVPRNQYHSKNNERYCRNFYFCQNPSSCNNVNDVGFKRERQWLMRELINTPLPFRAQKNNERPRFLIADSVEALKAFSQVQVPLWPFFELLKILLPHYVLNVKNIIKLNVTWRTLVFWLTDFFIKFIKFKFLVGRLIWPHLSI